jgi:hypothetical protein
MLEVDAIPVQDLDAFWTELTRRIGELHDPHSYGRGIVEIVGRNRNQISMRSF